MKFIIELSASPNIIGDFCQCLPLDKLRTVSVSGARCCPEGNLSAFLRGLDNVEELVVKNCDIAWVVSVVLPANDEQ